MALLELPHVPRHRSSRINSLQRSHSGICLAFTYTPWHKSTTQSQLQIIPSNHSLAMIRTKLNLRQLTPLLSHHQSPAQLQRFSLPRCCAAFVPSIIFNAVVSTGITLTARRSFLSSQLNPGTASASSPYRCSQQISSSASSLTAAASTGINSLLDVLSFRRSSILAPRQHPLSR